MDVPVSVEHVEEMNATVAVSSKAIVRSRR